VSGPPEARLGGLFATDERWMGEALRLAREAAARGEVPVGAVVVRDGVVLARGHNRVEALRDATAHAEILAIGAAGSARVTGAQAGDADEGDAEDSAAGGGDWRLDDATLYVTLEPCTMCCGAILLARVGRVVFGAADPRAGAVVSTARLLDGNPYRHRVEVVGGILAGPCADLLRGFFRDRRRDGQTG
jgi:tRNA(adenine34) deaminase